MDTDRAQSDDGWLEQALKADAQGAAYVADDGFTAGVMARLPQPATLPAWRRPVVALLWLIAGGAVVALLPDLFYTPLPEPRRAVRRATAHLVEPRRRAAVAQWHHLERAGLRDAGRVGPLLGKAVEGSA